MAMWNYEGKHGHLPAAVVYGKDDKPLYSWRVALLPFIEERELYREFRLDEPWDSPDNARLLMRMPAIYAAPGSKAKHYPPDHTLCHVFVGKGTPFEEDKVNLLESWSKRGKQAILIVEAGEAVPWTQPRELIYDADVPLPNLDGPFKDMFRAALVSGGVTYFTPREASEKEFRCLISREGCQEP